MTSNLMTFNGGFAGHAESNIFRTIKRRYMIYARSVNRQKGKWSILKKEEIMIERIYESKAQIYRYREDEEHITIDINVLGEWVNRYDSVLGDDPDDAIQRAKAFLYRIGAVLKEDRASEDTHVNIEKSGTIGETK